MQIHSIQTILLGESENQKINIVSIPELHWITQTKKRKLNHLRDRKKSTPFILPPKSFLPLGFLH